MILWALALLIFAMNLGYSIMIPILPDMLGRLDPTITESGRLMGEGVFFAGFNFAKILFQVPAGGFADRFGERRVVMISTVLYFLSLVLMIEAREFSHLYVARMIEGIATGVIYPAVTAIVMHHSSVDRLGRNMSLQIAAGGFGFVLGPAICSPVQAVNWGGSDVLYRPLWFMLWFTAVSGGLALACFLVVPRRPPKAGDPVELPASVEAALAPSEGLYAAQPAPPLPHKAGGAFMATVVEELRLIGRFARNVPLHLFIAPMLVDKMIITAMLAVVLEHGPSMKWHADLPRYLLFGLGLTFAICQFPAGWLADRVPARRLVIANLIGMTGGLVGLAFARTEAVFVPFYALYCIFASILMTVTMKLVTEQYHSKEGNARVAGVVLSVSDLGTVIGPVLYPWIYTFSPMGAFLAMGVSGVLATAAFWFSAGRERDLPQVEAR